MKDRERKEANLLDLWLDNIIPQVEKQVNKCGGTKNFLVSRFLRKSNLKIREHDTFTMFELYFV